MIEKLHMGGPHADQGADRMHYTRSFFKYYDAAEKLNSARVSLNVLLSRHIPPSEQTDTPYGYRRVMEYKRELESAQNDISVFGELRSRYSHELIQELKRAGIKPDTSVDISLCRGRALKVWYTDDGECCYSRAVSFN